MYSKPIPKSYRHLIDDKIFLDKEGNNIAEEIIEERFVTSFINVQTLLEKRNLIKYCTVNPDLLWKANLDYFEDIARLKAFHSHQHVQTDKIFAYEVFWYLRNHPIQIDNSAEMPEECLHVNEYIFSFWLVKKISSELESRFAPNIQVDNFIEKLEEHDLMIELRSKLYYTFRYRLYTQQTILLLIEGFMVAAEFTLQIT